MAISSIIGDALVPTSYGFRNVIINGNFSINQRGYTSGSNLASGAYGFDRWKSNYTNTTLTFTSAPQGQTVTISASGVIRQIIERANVQAGTYVLSWVGTATGRVYNEGASAPSYASGPLSVFLDGTANVIVEFTPASGTATLGQVQLEFGSRATPFEARPIGVELQFCQRYYVRFPGKNTSYTRIPSSGTIYSGSAWTGEVYHPVLMRDVASAIEVSQIRLTDRVSFDSTTVTGSSFNAGLSTTSLTLISVSGATGVGANPSGVPLVTNNTTAAYLGISAEL